MPPTPSSIPTTTTLCSDPIHPTQSPSPRPPSHTPSPIPLPSTTSTPMPHTVSPTPLPPAHAGATTSSSLPAPPAVAPPVPAPDVVAFFDPASAGGGGPLVRIATAHSAREQARSRSASVSGGTSGAAARPVVIAPLTLSPLGLALGLKRAATVAATPATRERRNRLSDHSDVDGSSDGSDSSDASDDEGGMSRKEHARNDNELRCEEKMTRYDEQMTVPKLDLAQTPAKLEAGADSPVNENENEVRPDLTTVHVYPDGGYGWVVVVCCTTLCALNNGWGMNWGVFQQYYSEQVWPEEDTAIISFIGTTMGFVMNAVAFISGRMGDRYGFKRVLALSAFMNWLGLFLASFSHSLWSTILTQGLILGIGQGIAVPLFMSLPSQWFYKYRGLASGIAMGGAGLGGGISSLVVRQLLTQVGVNKTLLIMSFVNLVAMSVAIALLRTRPTSPEAGRGRGPLINRTLLRRSDFWSIAVSLIIGVIGYGVPFTYLSQWMTATLSDLSPIQITAPLTALSFAVIIGRAGAGVSADKLGPINTYIIILIFSGVSQYALWLTAKTYAGAVSFGVIYGIIAPGYLGILPQIVVTLFGPAELASNVGLLLLFTAPGNLISGPMGGAIYEATGTFKWMIIVMGGSQILGGLIACWARFKTSPSLLARI